MENYTYKIVSKDGTRILNNAYNFDSTSIRGVVVVCHGFGEHAGRYREFAERLAAKDYACITFDQRGHGALRPDKLGTIPGYESFLDDIEAVAAKAAEILPGVPLVLFGHSMGGNIAANFLLRRKQHPFICGALESPWLGLHKESPAMNKLGKVLGALLPNMPLPKSQTKLPLDSITDDPEAQKELANDPYYHNRMTVRLFTNVHIDGCAHALENAAQISIPLQLTYAENESIVNNAAIRRFRDKCQSRINDNDFIGYKTNHCIHSGNKKDAFYGDLVAFFNRYCPAVDRASAETIAK